MATETEKRQEAESLLLQARAVLENPTAPAEEKAKVPAMIADAKRLQAEGSQLNEIKRMASDAAPRPERAPEESPKFRSLGHFLQGVHQAGDVRYRGQLHPALRGFKSKDRDEYAGPIDAKGTGSRWEEEKVLVENTGASGGFLVPTEFRAELYALQAPNTQIRSRATIIPMRRRAVQMPVLDQTATTSANHWMGGIVSSWTEETGLKAQTEPKFRKIELVAHKLVCYTLTSDELMDDEAIGLAGFLTGPMGFSGAIAWEEEYCFLRGTGVGQPLGVINAGATIVVPRQAGGTIGLIDIINMVSHIYGDNPVWHISRSAMPQLLQLNGPAANPSYVFIPNARDGMPATLFGYPVIWSDKLPAMGTQGDIVLADWRYYLIGDRQATTIDSTNAEYFRYDETSWRAVHRVDGQPWLSTWFTYQDGTTDVSPFVILGDKTT